jgi:hypothetical protein
MEFVQNLRDVADFLEAHPEIGTPETSTIWFHCWHQGKNAKQELAKIASIPGGWDKDVEEGVMASYRLNRDFGPLRISVSAWRSDVCEKFQVGTKVEPEHVIPAQEEQIVPERVVPVFEWKCPSLLAPEESVSA